MTDPDGRVSKLAADILDGASIDWAAAESAADDATQPVLAEFKVLATLVEAHRRLQQDDDSAPGRTTADANGTLTHWGHLRALERIGGGAFGEVYRAWDTRLDREVALKLIDADPDEPDAAASSIIHEGRLLARVRHANVITIYGAEQLGERIGLWMEFVRGRTLKEIVDGGKRFSAREAAHIGIDLCHAIAAVHGAGVLHRDIKAQNVMLADDGRVVLMDFGTGREFADNSRSDLAGTPLYLAPEVIANREATVQSDIYSLGVLLYYLVNGSYPVEGRTLQDVRRAHEARGDPAAIRDAMTRSGISPKFARIIGKAIAFQPERRYGGADAFAADLAAFNAGHRPRSVYAAAVVALLVVLGALAWAVTDRMGFPRRTDAGTTPPVIAVLPFKNLSAEADSNYFVDGLTDEIIRHLASIRGLQVRSRTSSFAFQNKPRSLPDVGRQLGANLVVEGSVLRSGTKLRVNAQLVTVAGDVPLWSERFDRELQDVFNVQDEISRAIVNKLRLTIGAGQRRYDTSTETYDLYLKGRALLDLRGIPGGQMAAEAFRQAIAKDPEFAPAYAGLANAYAQMAAPASSTLPFKTAQSVIDTNAAKARQLDPLLADAQVATGWSYAYAHEWTNAEAAFKRALELNPSLTQAYTAYSLSTLEPLGRFDEALHILDLGLRNDPLSLDLQRAIGDVQFHAGRYREAVETLERVHTADPEFPFVGAWLGRALTFAGRPDEAIALLDQQHGRNLGQFKPATARRPPYLALPYVRTGRRPAAESLLAEHRESPYGLVIIYAALGDTDRAIDALYQVATSQPHQIGRVLRCPELADVGRDPRVQELRQRFGLPR